MYSLKSILYPFFDLTSPTFWFVCSDLSTVSMAVCRVLLSLLTIEHLIGSLRCSDRYIFSLPQSFRTFWEALSKFFTGPNVIWYTLLSGFMGIMDSLMRFLNWFCVVTAELRYYSRKIDSILFWVSWEVFTILLVIIASKSFLNFH